MTDARLDRIGDAAAYAEDLRAELDRITAMLDRYRGSPGLEIMCDRSSEAQRRLKALVDRLVAPGMKADLGHYALSQPEHLLLESALDIRDRLAESLSRYKRAEDLNAEADPE